MSQAEGAALDPHGTGPAGVGTGVGTGAGPGGVGARAEGEGWGERTQPNRRCTNCLGGPAARATRHPRGGTRTASDRWAGPRGRPGAARGGASASSCAGGGGAGRQHLAPRERRVRQ